MSGFLEQGARVAHFVVRGRLGAGGMGVVYRATDEKLGREVALKLLLASAVGSPERRQRFLREARAGAALTHPSVATIFEVGEHGDQVYLAMELVRGRSVAEQLRSGPFDEGEALRVASAVAAALAHAHERGIVHRDIKPDNVMLTSDAFVKVLDFGIAKLLDVEPTESAPTVTAATREGAILGTPGYMSPEQAEGSAVDHRTDIFSLGALLYAMLSGKAPFTGASLGAVVAATLRDPPTPIDSRRVSQRTIDVVTRCLEKAPGDRFASCQELLDTLSEGLPRKPMRRTRRPLLIGLGAVVTLAVAGLWRAAKSPTRHPVPSPSAVTSASSRGTAITDLPVGGSPDPRALDEYRRGLQARRDAAWGISEGHFRRAVELDPTFPEPRLRLAQLARFGEPGEFGKQLATQRDALGARDQALFEALLPLTLTGSRNVEEYTRRLRSLTERYPRDAELLTLYAGELRRSDDPSGALPLIDRALAIDERYADALQLRGDVFKAMGRVEESLSAYEECTRVSPIADDCYHARTTLLSFEGRCEEALRSAAEADARRDAGQGHEHRAHVAAALGQPRERVSALLERGWSEWYNVTRDLPFARMEVFYGDFDSADERLKRAVAGGREQPAVVRGHLAYLWSELLVERGRDRRAAEVAHDYLTTAPAEGASFFWTMRLAEIANEHYPADLEAKRRDFEAAIGRIVPSATERWIAVWAADATSTKAATAALATLRDERHVEDRFRGASEHRQPMLALLGRVHALAGRADAGATYLRRMTKTCNSFADPFLRVRAHLWLGDALHAKGDHEEACSAYREVVARWGGAGRSVTVDAAKAGAKRIGCELR